MERLILLEGAKGPLDRMESLARKKGVPVERVPRAFFEKHFPGENHQGVVGFIQPYTYASVEEILALAQKRQEPPFVVVLDQIEDPHNLGAIMRSAEGAGAHGVIIGKRNAVGLTYGVAKSSAGAVEHLPCARVTNLAETIKMLQEKGLWVTAADMGGPHYAQGDYRGPTALVIGNEGKGIRPLVRKQCDFVASIPLKGKITSLNASVAAGILLYEIQRQRNEK